MIHMKFQALFSLKIKKVITKIVVFCRRNWYFHGIWKVQGQKIKILKIFSTLEIQIT